MFVQWVVDGVGWAVRFSFAVLTIAVIVAAILGLLACLALFTGGDDDEAQTTYRGNRTH